MIVGAEPARGDRVQTPLKAPLCAHDLCEYGWKKHQVHQLWIELRAPAGQDDSLRLLRRPAVPVSPPMRHDVEGVRERDDARGERDPTPTKAAGIPAPVPALVVAENCLRQLRVKVADGAQNLRAANGMRPDGAALGGSETARLVHDVEQRLVNFSNVVEQRRELDRAAHTLIDAERVRDGKGVGGYASNVSSGLRVIGIDGPEQRLERRCRKPLSSMALPPLIDENAAERDAGREENGSNHGHNKGKN